MLRAEQRQEQNIRIQYESDQEQPGIMKRNDRKEVLPSMVNVVVIALRCPVQSYPTSLAINDASGKEVMKGRIPWRLTAKKSSTMRRQE
jgi:hypothetical protein